MKRVTNIFRRRIYYGWWVSLACAGIGFFTGGIAMYGRTVFVNPIVNEFGWTYVQFSVAILIQGIAMALMAPLFGLLVDRFGSRRILFAGAFIAGAGLLLLSRIDSLLTFYLAFGVISIGFVALGTVVLSAAVLRWFRQRAGLALGITTSGIGLGGLMITLLTWLVDQYDWRMALVITGVGVTAIVLALAAVVRNNPEPHPSTAVEDATSAPPKPSPAVSSAAAGQVSWTVQQALRTRTFWQLVMALLVNFAGVNAVLLHVVPYLEDQGLSGASAALVATFVPLLSVVGRLGFGRLADVISNKYSLVLAVVVQTAGLAAFTLAPSMWALAVFAIAFGAGMGGMVAVTPAMNRSLYGLRHFGSILGLVFAITAIGGIMGPMLASWVYDTWGNYNLAWYGFIGGNVVSLTLLLTIRRSSTKAP
jgi:MFS family permease